MALNNLSFLTIMPLTVTQSTVFCGLVGCKTFPNMEKKGSLTTWTYRMADSWTSSNVRKTASSVFYETLEEVWSLSLHPYGKP